MGKYPKILTLCDLYDWESGKPGQYRHQQMSYKPNKLNISQLSCIYNFLLSGNPPTSMSCVKVDTIMVDVQNELI